MSGVQDRMTERARVVLEYSLREAISLGHNYIGTEHILLALVREDQGLAGKVLEAMGLERDKVRMEVMRVLGEPCNRALRRRGQQMTKKAHWLEAERLLQQIASSEVDMERQRLGTEALVHAALASSSVELA